MIFWNPYWPICHTSFIACNQWHKGQIWKWYKMVNQMTKITTFAVKYHFCSIESWIWLKLLGYACFVYKRDYLILISSAISQNIHLHLFPSWVIKNNDFFVQTSLSTNYFLQLFPPAMCNVHFLPLLRD